MGKLNEKFGNTASAIPLDLGSTPDCDRLLAAIKQMVNLFLVNGFAWGGSASIVRNGMKHSDRDAVGAQFVITFTSPATLWSGQSLKAKRAVLVNDFPLKTARALVSRFGYEITNASINYDNNQE